MGLRPEVCDIGAHLEGQPHHHHPHPGQIRSPTCRLAENWKMAVTGAVNRPEARLRPDPRRKAPWAAGWSGTAGGRSCSLERHLPHTAWGRGCLQPTALSSSRPQVGRTEG